MNSEKMQPAVKDSRRPALVYIYGTLALGLLTALLYTLAFLFSFEKEMCYFYTGAVLPVICRICLGAVILCAFAYPFIFKKVSFPDTLPESRGFRRFITVFAGYICIFDSLYRAKNIYSGFSQNLTYFDKTLTDYSTYRLYRVSFVLSFIAVVFSACSALFFLGATRENGRKNSMKLLGMFPAVRACIGTAVVYFDMSLAMNVPQKFIVELGLMSCVLFFLAEERLRLSAEYAKPALYVSMSLLAASLCAVSGLSLTVSYYRYSSYYSATKLASCYGEIFTEAFFCLVIFLYIISGFFTYLGGKNKKLSPAGSSEQNEETGTAEAAEPATEKDVTVAQANAESVSENAAETQTSDAETETEKSADAAESGSCTDKGEEQ